MTQNHQFLSRILHQGSRALAAYAARELLEACPEAKQGFEPDPFDTWQNWLVGRIEELAAAVAAKRPRLFLSQIHWARTILVSRGVSPSSFHAGLQCLKDVLARELPDSAQSLADEYLSQAIEAFDQQTEDASERLSVESAAGLLASKYLLAGIEGDRHRAKRLLLEALEHERSVPSLYLDVLLPAQREIGRMWLANEINVVEEHITSQTTKWVMPQLLARVTLPSPNGKTLFAAAVAGNQHDIGLHVIADFFEMDGWRAIQLGANVPVRDLVLAVTSYDVNLLALSACQTTQLETLRETIDAVRDSSVGAKVQIIVGGLAFTGATDLATELGADGYANGPIDAVDLGNRLIP